MESTIINCKFDGCKSKMIDKGYCGKHQKYIFKDIVDASNNTLKLCSKFKLRGCTEILPIDYPTKTCEKCKEKENIKDKEDRKKIKIINETNNDNTTQKCNKCHKFKPKEEFISTNSRIIVKCVKCRESDERSELKRKGKRDRKEESKIYEQNPKIIQMRQQYRIAHKDESKLRSQKCRAKQMIEKLDEYLAHNAELMKTYRDNNPDKFKELNKLKKIHPKRRYYELKYSAESRSIDFTLTFDECINLFNTNCFYCGELDCTEQLNDIDRLNNDIGYTNDNCVPCCKICNNMKLCLDIDIFLLMIKHILTNLNLIQSDVLYHEIFPDYRGTTTYDKYKYRANNKNLDFQLTNDEFNNIINNNCYICDKKISETHLNGIDRLNNEIGYCIENCKPCCGTCNYMKKNLTYDTFIKQLLKIYNNINYDTINEELLDEKQNKILTNMKRDKPTKEEKQQNSILKKEEKKQNAINKSIAFINKLTK